MKRAHRGSIPGSVRVRNERDVVHAIREAQRNGWRTRAAGSGGSKNGAYDTTGLTIQTDALDRLIAVHDRHVTVSPGMTCGQLNAQLRRYDLVLPSVGEWECATVAGSLATGTHGGSTAHGIMATAVRALQFVDGTGRVHRLERGHEDFRHAAVGLGALGIVTAVTLDCERRFGLRLDTDVVGIDDYARDPFGQESRAEFHASVWIPSARRVIRYAADRIVSGDGQARRPLRFGPRTAIASALSRAGQLPIALSRALFSASCRGDCAAILSPIAVAPRLVRWMWSVAGSFRASELAFPAECAAEIIEELRRLIDRYPTELRNPIGLRMTEADDFSLSPAYGRPTLWVDMFYRSSRLVDEAIRSLAERFDARCHWGKHLAIPAPTLATRYPRWASFVDACRRYDPQQLFANRLTDSLALTTGTAS